MKISYKHLLKNIESNPSIEELSEKLFQLGHEHEVVNEIFDLEFTPNRGDCLSLYGLLRDLALFYEILNCSEIYEPEIKSFDMQFINNCSKYCRKISFLKIEIDEIPNKYEDFLNDFFLDLDIKKNNFFTDISNYISYETGQPTHCYDLAKIIEPIRLDFIESKTEFETLLDKKISIDENNLVFYDNNNRVINLAGVIGSKETACNKKTTSVLVECAHFDPEQIIGKTIKYGINSEAAYKFERNTDPNCHDFVLRRFLKIIELHTSIKSIELYEDDNSEIKKESLYFDLRKINYILGTDIETDECIKYLDKLGFIVKDEEIFIPSHRNDIFTINDICEEVARAIGYDNIKRKEFQIDLLNSGDKSYKENKIKKLLVDMGFSEVINDPFVNEGSDNSIAVDNPLDSNRKFLRTSLKDSLLDNLLYNERRQNDSVKFFEISDIYSSSSNTCKRVLGIIASGRVAKNYEDFSKKIDIKYIQEALKSIIDKEYNIENISRESIGSKSKNLINYVEIELDNLREPDYSYDQISITDMERMHYVPISDFPSSTRDLSFSVKDFSTSELLQKMLLNFEHDLLKEVFIFDFFLNEKQKEIKIGFRFTFQSTESTVTDVQVNEVMNDIIKKSLNLESVSIPGLL